MTPSIFVSVKMVENGITTRPSLNAKLRKKNLLNYEITISIRVVHERYWVLDYRVEVCFSVYRKDSAPIHP